MNTKTDPKPTPTPEKPKPDKDSQGCLGWLTGLFKGKPTPK
jgi:hypothetical protein